jgi:hypothetical protein
MLRHARAPDLVDELFEILRLRPLRSDRRSSGHQRGRALGDAVGAAVRQRLGLADRTANARRRMASRGSPAARAAAEPRLDRPDDALLEDVGGQARTARPGTGSACRRPCCRSTPRVLPVDVVAEQRSYIWCTYGSFENMMWPAWSKVNPPSRDRAAPAADGVACLEQQATLAEVVGGAQPGRPGADDHRVVLRRRRAGARPEPGRRRRCAPPSRPRPR